VIGVGVAGCRWCATCVNRVWHIPVPSVGDRSIRFRLSVASGPPGGFDITNARGKTTR